MMKYIFILLTAFFIIPDVFASWQNQSAGFSNKELTKEKIITAKNRKSDKEEHSSRAGMGIITGVTVSAIKANNVSVSYPYTAFSYVDNNYHYYYVSQRASMKASPSNTQYLLGFGVDYATRHHTYLECEGEIIAPFSGNDITAINVGGGVSARSSRHRIEFRLGTNLFYMSRKARLGEIDNHRQNINIANTTFNSQYYSSRKKDSTIVYDLYDATSIEVSHNEYYVGIQPKCMVDFEDHNSAAFVRIHLGWNLPFQHDKSIDFEQKGSRFATVKNKPTQYNTRSTASLDTSNPLLHYQSDTMGATFTTGMFVKVEVGIKLFDE